jgi:HEAT repeat protein
MGDDRKVAESLLDALQAALADRELEVAQSARTVDPDELVAAVGDQEDAVRRNAAIEALTKGGDRSVPSLIRALRHKDPEVIMFAAGILGKTRDPAAIPHLVQLLESEEINVAQAAIDSLAQLRATVAVDALIHALDRDPWLRFAAVHALGEIGDERGVEPLVPLLEDEVMRPVVVEALGRIGTPTALAVLSRVLRETQQPDVFGSCLRAIGEALERNPDPELLSNVTSFTQLAGPEAMDVHMRLVRVLATEEPSHAEQIELKGAAAAVIRALRLRPLYTTLVLAGRDPTLKDVLQFCAVAIGPEIASSLEVGLGFANPHVRLLACQCLGSLGLAPMAPRLEPLLDDPDEIVRAAATQALVRLGYEPAIPRLVKSLRDASVIVRDAAKAGLARMDAETVTAALLANPIVDAPTRLLALEICAQNAHSRQRTFLLACLDDQSPEVRRLALTAAGAQVGWECVERVAEALRDPHPKVRRAALAILPRYREKRVRKLLLDHIERDSETRPDAVRALATLRDGTVAPHLITLLKREDARGRLAIIDTLAELREPASEPMLVSLLADGDGDVRRAAVQALGRFGSVTALRHVRAAVRDPAWQVRAAAAEAVSPARDPNATAALEDLSMDSHPEVAQIARRRLAESQATPRSGELR